MASGLGLDVVNARWSVRLETPIRLSHQRCLLGSASCCPVGGASAQQDRPSFAVKPEPRRLPSAIHCHINSGHLGAVSWSVPTRLASAAVPPPHSPAPVASTPEPSYATTAGRGIEVSPRLLAYPILAAAEPPSVASRHRATGGPLCSLLT